MIFCSTNASVFGNGQTENTHLRGGKITVWLVSSLAILDLTKDEHGLLFVCSETVESNLVKLEMRCTVILTLQ